jgi:hypothetical protein
MFKIVSLKIRLIDHLGLRLEFVFVECSDAEAWRKDTVVVLGLDLGKKNFLVNFEIVRKHFF